MMKYCRAFVQSEDGGVTVDWVVVTALVLALTIGVFSLVTQTLLSDAGTRISDLILSALDIVPHS